MNPKHFQTKYLIIGAGLTGLSAASHLRDNYLIAEASDSCGGTAGTLYYKNFKLDNAVHILYFKQSDIKKWIVDQLKINLLEKRRENSIWIDNRYVRFPLQYHLSDLPLLSRSRAFASIWKTRKLTEKKEKYKNFEDYSLSVFGEYITNVFVRPYNEKLFGVPLNQMNIEWMGDYVPKYSKTKMLLSASGLVNRNYGRNSNYYYPSEGGISTIAKGISSQLKISPKYNCSLLKISLDQKTATFTDGTEINYKYLINTIPLDTFLDKIENQPSTISETTLSLKKNSTTLLHILVKGSLATKYDWIYVPDQEIPFYRITFPGNINPLNCPDKHFALTLEFGGDVYKNEEILNSSISTLQTMGILDKNDSDIEHYWRFINCGYVIYDDNRTGILSNVLPFLQRNDIWSVGRYGSWEYSNMEDAILNGKRIAQDLKTR